MRDDTLPLTPAGRSARHSETIVLTRADVRALLPMRACIEAVERAFLMHARGATDAPGVLGTHVARGGFHVKTAGLASPHGRHVFVAKVNANFPGNLERLGLPTIQGVIVLFDAETGELLAVLDSIEVTSLRTAAATAVAARHLAREDASVVTVVGCGAQGRSQLRALGCVRHLRRVFAFDVVAERAHAYASEMSRELGVDVVVATELTRGARDCDLCVTCTTSAEPVLHLGDVRPGTFVAAVGADNPHKHEIAPDLLASSTVVADVLEQCATMGDLHHAIAAGAMRREDVHAELAEVVAGTKAGRRSDDEITVFDSTGTAIEDVAAAAVVYERALGERRGTTVMLGV